MSSFLVAPALERFDCFDYLRRVARIMSEVPEGLYYTKEHEWIRVEGDEVVIGITDHAQDALTDIVYIELARSWNDL